MPNRDAFFFFFVFMRLGFFFLRLRFFFFFFLHFRFFLRLCSLKYASSFSEICVFVF